MPMSSYAWNDPELKRQVVFATLVEALVTVVVTIDEPGRHQSAAEVDHSAARLPGARRADLPDHLAFDHDVDRSVARPCVFAEQGQATRERFFISACQTVPDGEHSGNSAWNAKTNPTWCLSSSVIGAMDPSRAALLAQGRAAAPPRGSTATWRLPPLCAECLLHLPAWPVLAPPRSCRR